MAAACGVWVLCVGSNSVCCEAWKGFNTCVRCFMLWKRRPPCIHQGGGGAATLRAEMCVGSNHSICLSVADVGLKASTS
jgi:hypothetical protein